MDTSNLDARIRDAETVLARERDLAERAASDLRVKACEFVSQWINETITREVTRKPEVSKVLGVEGLGRLKRDLAELSARLPALVETELGKDELWPHRSESIDRDVYYQMHGYRPPDRLEGVLRKLLGHGGELLVRYGFEQPGQHASWEQQGGSWRYRYGYDVSKGLTDAVGIYSKAFDRVKGAAAECDTAKQAREQAEAADLWTRA